MHVRVQSRQILLYSENEFRLHNQLICCNQAGFAWYFLISFLEYIIIIVIVDLSTLQPVEMVHLEWIACITAVETARVMKRVTRHTEYASNVPLDGKMIIVTKVRQ